MRYRILLLLAMVFIRIGIKAQGYTFERVRTGSTMSWTCPEIAKYQGLLISLKDDDYKVYASNVMGQFKPCEDPSTPGRMLMLTQAVLTTDNPQFDVDNLNDCLERWLRKYEWHKDLKHVGSDGKILQTIASLNVSSHTSFGIQNKVFVFPTLTMQLVEGNKLIISFATDYYKYVDYNKSDGKVAFSYEAKFTDVYPFVQKSSYKNSFAKAYVGTYQAFWNSISELRNYLNTNFTKDTKLLTQLQYQHSKDSLISKYGQPDKVITGLSNTLDFNREMYIFENAGKIVFMGKTISFKDIMSCEIVDDPKFIPGRSSTGGIGIGLFGIAFGGAETTRTPDKTIHNYVVDVKIDNLSTPFIRIATGQSDDKATEIASVFEYILRHQTEGKPGVQKQKTVTRRRK